MSIATYEGIIREGRIQLIEPVALPEESRVFVVVPASIDENTARRKANRWLIENIGNMVMADRPDLIWTGGRPVWRFGAYITAPSHPPKGPIGYVDVNAVTSEILVTEGLAEEMIRNGEHFASAVRAADS